MTRIPAVSPRTVDEAAPAAAPVAAAGRIDSLDVLRGFAVLGILIMNIQSFGLPMAAYMNPTVAGGFTGANYWVWVVGHLLADLKFMSIFSMLFGAGVILFTSRLEARGQSSIGLHYRRMGWLLLIGMIHAYLLWYGDILVLYSLCGMLLYWTRRWRPRTLLSAAIVSVLITTTLTALSGYWYSILHTAVDEYDRQALVLAPEAEGEPAEAGPEQAPQARAEEATSERQAEVIEGISLAQARQAIEEMRNSYDPPPEMIEKEVSAMTGSYLDEVTFRALPVVFMQTLLVMFYGWRILGMMLLGMALFKWGVLSAARSMALYVAMATAGFLLGLPLIWIGFRSDVAVNFYFLNSKFFYSHYNYFGSIFVALGWIGVIMLLCRSGVLQWLIASLGAVGRMAFTNYLMHTIICTTIFNGRSGLGLAKFNQLERTELLIIVAAIFLFQMIASPIWLRYFRFGPFEWLWRSLTYWKLQPMRRADVRVSPGA